MHVQYQSRDVKEAVGNIALEVRGESWAGPIKGTVSMWMIFNTIDGPRVECKVRRGSKSKL